MPDKKENLINYLRSFGKCAVAFSGGCDSTFLLKTAFDVLGRNCTAVTYSSPLVSLADISDCVSFCKKENIRHIIIREEELTREVEENTEMRCYFCKKNIFSRIIVKANEEGIETVTEGTNSEDSRDYRPGMKALTELGVISPLSVCGISKQEVRDYSLQFGLKTHDKPSSACLASRIPYGEKITPAKLDRIEKAEKYISELGFSSFRVRSHGDLARIEFLADDFKKAFEENVRREISSKLKELGFHYVALDADGFYSGSLNREIKVK